MQRNFALDNTKSLMILLVVFGHLVEPIVDTSALIKTIYMSIYSIHMPVFIILAGMLSKVEFSRARIASLVESLVIPLLAFTLMYEAFSVITNNELSIYTKNFQPYWILWFLFSLFLWRLLLPVMLQFRYPIAISIAITLAAGSVTQVGYFLGMARTLYFFPFFLIGHLFGSSVLSNVSLKKVPKFVYVSILILNIWLFWILSEHSHHWLYGSYSYHSLGVGHMKGMLMRFSLIVVSIISAFSILMLAPNSQYRISASGTNSLYVYLWHGFFVKTLIILGWVSLISNLSASFALAVALFTASILTTLLSSHFVATHTQKWIFSPLKKLVLLDNK